MKEKINKRYLGVLFLIAGLFAIYIVMSNLQVKSHGSIIRLDLTKDSVISFVLGENNRMIFQIRKKDSTIYLYQDSVKQQLYSLKKKDSIIVKTSKKEQACLNLVKKYEKSNDSLRNVINSYERVKVSR
jgi:predicted polyphosphate/ATP-dependent NAD kinase